MHRLYLIQGLPWDYDSNSMKPSKLHKGSILHTGRIPRRAQIIQRNSSKGFKQSLNLREGFLQTSNQANPFHKDQFTQWFSTGRHISWKIYTKVHFHKGFPWGLIFMEAFKFQWGNYTCKCHNHMIANNLHEAKINKWIHDIDHKEHKYVYCSNNMHTQNDI